jgi:hypothetical protein
MTKKSAFEEETWTRLQCQAFLYKARWPDGFVCPHCWGRKQWPLKNGRQTCVACRKQTSVTAITRLQGCRVPLPQILLAARYTVSSPSGLTANQLKDAVGLSRYETAFDLLRLFRSVMAVPTGDILTGTIAITTVSVPAADSTTVLVACADNTHEHPHVLFRVISSPIVDPGGVLDSRVARNATILAPPGLEVSGLAAQGHEVRTGGPGDAVLMTRCTRLAEALRAWLQDVHGGAVLAKNLQKYLDEFAFHAEYGDPEQAYAELIRRLVQDRRFPIDVPPGIV